MKPALGKGLSALIPKKEEKIKAGDDAQSTRALLDLNIDDIKPNKYQPRRVFRDSALNDLVESIAEKGVIQPVIVRKDGAGSYELIAGERRWRAAGIAGLKSIPAIIKDAAPVEALELALIENIQREDLNPMETAEAFERLVNDFDLTHEDLSKKVGKDRATVSNYMRILKLPDEVKKLIAAGALTIGHAKALLQIENTNALIDLARKSAQSGLSVRAVEQLARKIGNAHPSGSRKTKPRDPQIASLEEKLIQSLGTKVRLRHNANNRGRVEIEYYSLEELDRLLDILIS